jgi:protein-tyrosine phosphatase
MLPGIDDGPATIEDSLALVRAALATGTHTTVATPHVSRRYPNNAGRIARLVDDLKARLASEGLALNVLRGAEIAMTQMVDLTPDELRRLGLGGGQWLLVEPPFTAVTTNLDAILLRILDRGHRIVLAHPERCIAFQRHPETLVSLVEAGALTSITAGALVGDFGSDVRCFALDLVRAGMVHNVASDAHDHVRRKPGMAVELEQAGLGPLTDWLTQLVPAAILSGLEIPPRPEVQLASIHEGTAG